MATKSRTRGGIILLLGLIVWTKSIEIVKQGANAGDVVLESGGVDLWDVGEGHGRDVASGGSSISRGSSSGGGGSKEAGADYRGLQEG